MSKHTVDYVIQHAQVMVKGGNKFNPNTFWRMPTDMTSWDEILVLAQLEGWRSYDLDGDISRVGSDQGPNEAVLQANRR